MHTCVFIATLRQNALLPSRPSSEALHSAAKHSHIRTSCAEASAVSSVRTCLSIARAFSPHTCFFTEKLAAEGWKGITKSSISITPSSPAICAHCCSACKKLQKKVAARGGGLRRRRGEERTGEGAAARRRDGRPREGAAVHGDAQGRRGGGGRPRRRAARSGQAAGEHVAG